MNVQLKVCKIKFK